MTNSDECRGVLLLLINMCSFIFSHFCHSAQWNVSTCLRSHSAYCDRIFGVEGGTEGWRAPGVRDAQDLEVQRVTRALQMPVATAGEVSRHNSPVLRGVRSLLRHDFRIRLHHEQVCATTYKGCSRQISFKLHIPMSVVVCFCC